MKFRDIKIIFGNYAFLSVPEEGFPEFLGRDVMGWWR